MDIEDFFTSGLKGNRKLARATRRADRINDLKGDTNYNYRLARVCGNGWLALGDAARFIDPVFSSGVCGAMHGARFAAERIGAAYRDGDFSREAFLPYEDHVFSGAAIWDDFVRLSYRLWPAFTHLLESRDHRRAILQMIQGDVHGDTDASVLEELRTLVRSVEEADNHPWKGELIKFPV